MSSGHFETRITIASASYRAWRLYMKQRKVIDDGSGRQLHLLKGVDW